MPSERAMTGASTLGERNVVNASPAPVPGRTATASTASALPGTPAPTSFDVPGEPPGARPQPGSVRPTARTRPRNGDQRTIVCGRGMGHLGQGTGDASSPSAP